LNKAKNPNSKSDMYNFVDDKWNPVKGKCPYNCVYCYMKRFKKAQSPLRLDASEFRSLGRGNTYFVCSGCDLFHPDVPEKWIEEIAKFMRDNDPSINYILHTKNPKRLYGFGLNVFPANASLCVTVESNIQFPGISLAPQPYERIEYFKELNNISPRKNNMITMLDLR